MVEHAQDAESTEDVVEQAKQDSVVNSEITKERQEHMDRWQALSEKAQELLISEEGLRQVVGAMLASRQLYAMALTDMDVRVDGLEVDEDDKDQLREIFISASAKQAANPFDENELFRGMEETVMPWMKSVAKEHTLLEERTRREEIQSAEKERRGKNVKIGVEYVQLDKVQAALSDELNRTRTLVLAGWRPAVLWVINHMLEYVTSQKAFATSLAPKQTVVLTRRGGGHSDPRIMTIGEKGWENCAKSNDGWKRTFQELYLDKLKDPVDLFVVTDLAHAREGHGFQSPTAKASEAQKKLRKWATVMGAAFVGAVLLDGEKLPDFNTPIWEQLRLFTYLRGVGVEVRKDGDYDIIVGRHTRIEGVSKKEVDAFSSSDIITP